MFLSRKFLFLFFGFFFFYLRSTQEIDKEDKELSVTVENVGILKKVAALSNKEKLLLICEILGGKVLKYHFFLISFFYLWDILTKKILKYEIKYAWYGVHSWCILTPFLIPDGALILFSENFERLSSLFEKYPILFFLPSSVFCALYFPQFSLNLNMCKKISLNTRCVSFVSCLINIILMSQEKLFIFLRASETEKLLNNALDSCIENNIHDCEDYFLLLGDTQKSKVIKNLINKHSFEKISVLIKNDKIKEFFLRYHHDILHKAEVPDDLKLEILAPAKNNFYVIREILKNLCYLEDKEKRQELVNYCLHYLDNENNIIDHFWFDLSFIDNVGNRIIHFYDDIYIIARPLLQKLIEQDQNR